MFKRLFFALLILTGVLSPVYGQSGLNKIPGGTVYHTTIRDSTLKFDHANYSVFIPDSIQEIRGIFIHQHGCTMEGRGASTAYDIQYQAFARKWHLAILGPDLYPKTNSNCWDWRNPEEGSGPALLAGLDSIAQLSNHPELKIAPWLLWGHSGGGYWVLAMINAYPDRIIAAVCYSPAFDPHFPYPEAASKIPVIIRHAGSRDFNSVRANCWGTALHTFSILRNMDGPVSIAYTPRQNHNLSYIRYIAIPFFESVLAQRLQLNGSKVLNDMDQKKAWLCDTTTNANVQVYKASSFTGDKHSMSWLPDSACAVKFKEYITTGSVQDNTAPLAPENLKIVKGKDSLTLSWTADADLESGIGHFNIYINNQLFARYPSTGDFQTFKTNGDDAVPVIPPVMTYMISGFSENRIDTIAITTVNRFEIESPKTKLFISNLP
ncbi:MAG: lysophospholipase [Prolixibacteraceae bacterium]|jgi:pimeloyl-ACP methyl ester carboxylesterase|nr:lysophospholipase [Prolixibacteraceae bacterium]